MRSMSKMNLNDKICLWKEQPENEEKLRGLFIAEEWDILKIIHKFGIFRNVGVECFSGKGKFDFYFIFELHAGVD